VIVDIYQIEKIVRKSIFLKAIFDTNQIILFLRVHDISYI